MCDPQHVGIDVCDVVAAYASCNADDRVVVNINSCPKGYGDSLVPHQTVYILPTLPSMLQNTGNMPVGIADGDFIFP